MDKKRKIEDEMYHILNAMKSMEVDSEEYTNCVKNLKALYEARSMKKSFPISLETILIAMTSIIEIGLMLNFERLGVITSKVLGRIVRSI